LFHGPNFAMKTSSLPALASTPPPKSTVPAIPPVTITFAEASAATPEAS
jgi:hypothetical protein